MTTAAVVVTFNRSKLLFKCIEALTCQSVHLDRIYIIDNASTDGTEQQLDRAGYLSDYTITYVRLPTNIGGAGGFSFGMKLAYENGYDWVWIMDDDAEPDRDALKLMQGTYGEQSAVANMVFDATGRPQLHHRGYFSSIGDASIVRPIDRETLKEAYANIEFASFVGIAFSRGLISKVGFPDARFFIHYDDNEYCMRISQICRIKLVVESVMRHNSASIDNLDVRRNWFGVVRSRIQYDKLWLSYFGFRNSFWLKLQKCRWQAYIVTIPILVRILVGILLFDDKKRRRARLWIAAFNDARNSEFDNSKPRAILYG